jgi:broad specificity phosphatase PhoE
VPGDTQISSQLELDDVGTDIVFETHSISEDNETGIASGWLPGRLSATGRELAAALGQRRSADDLAAVFSSDLGRALQTAAIAFAHSDVPVLADWRLRECDYGTLNGAPAVEVHANRSDYLDEPYPGGESWTAATDRVRLFLKDLALHWDGARVLVIGHVATRMGLERFLLGKDLAGLISSEFVWQEGWEYRLEKPLRSGRSRGLPPRPSRDVRDVNPSEQRATR